MILLYFFLIGDCLGFNDSMNLVELIRKSKYPNVFEFKYENEFSFLKVLQKDSYVEILRSKYVNGNLCQTKFINKLYRFNFRRLLKEICLLVFDFTADQLEHTIDSTIIKVGSIDNSSFDDYQATIKDRDRKIVNIYIEKEDTTKVRILQNCLKRIACVLQDSTTLNFLTSLEIQALESSSATYVTVQPNDVYKLVLTDIEKFDKTSKLVIAIDFTSLNVNKIIKEKFDCLFETKIKHLCREYLKKDMEKHILQILANKSSVISLVKKLEKMREGTNSECLKNLFDIQFSLINDKSDDVCVFNHTYKCNKKTILFLTKSSESLDALEKVMELSNKLKLHNMNMIIVIFELLRTSEFTFDIIKECTKKMWFRIISTNIGLTKKNSILNAAKTSKILQRIDFSNQFFFENLKMKTNEMDHIYFPSLKLFYLFILIEYAKKLGFTETIVPLLDILDLIFVIHFKWIRTFRDDCLKSIQDDANTIMKECKEDLELSKKRSCKLSKIILLS